MAYMRYYGMEAGDPKPRPVPKRKSAAAGPRVKAQRKRVVRSKRAARGSQGGGAGAVLGKVAGSKAVQDRVNAALSQLRSGNLTGAAASALLGSGKGGGGGVGGGGKRRSINPANTKALRRALRRFDGFSNLVKRVNKFLPTGAKFTHHKPCAPSKRGKR